jgi:hypothetical protein
MMTVTTMEAVVTEIPAPQSVLMQVVEQTATERRR